VHEAREEALLQPPPTEWERQIIVGLEVIKGFVGLAPTA
jgi:hypothetical protein